MRTILDALARPRPRILAQIGTAAAGVAGAVLLANDTSGLRFVGGLILVALILAAVKLGIVAMLQARQLAGVHEQVARRHADLLGAAAARIDELLERQVADRDADRDAIREIREILDANSRHFDEHRRLFDEHRRLIDELRAVVVGLRDDDLALTSSRIDALSSELAAVQQEYAELQSEFARLMARTSPDTESVALLVRRTEPAIAELAIIRNEMLELRELVERVDRRQSH